MIELYLIRVKKEGLYYFLDKSFKFFVYIIFQGIVLAKLKEIQQSIAILERIMTNNTKMK